MRVLGIKILGHDTGAALLHGDQTFAISQERLDRKKYSSAFPGSSIEYCLRAAGFSNLSQIDCVAVEQMEPETTPYIRLLEKQGLWPDIASKTVFVNHHDAHAASAFFCSLYDEAAVLVVDNGGRSLFSPDGKRVVETESFYAGSGHTLQLLHRNYQPVNKKTGNLLGISGVGNFYSQVTYFINFGKHEEGKTMGLAPYGTGKFMNIPQEQFIKKISPWQYIFPTPLEPHPGYDWPYLFKKNSYSRKENWINLMRHGVLPKRHTAFAVLPEVFKAAKRRNNLTKLPDTFYTELAYWAQIWLERVMIEYATHLQEVTKFPNLCIAGGVGLNSVANKKILDTSPFKNIFIQPAAGDSGLPLGAALWAKHHVKKEKTSWRMTNAYLGRTYGEKEILEALEGKNYQHLENPSKTAAELIAQEKIIGWFQGSSEFGPRALGNRSIICSPIPAGMRDKLNIQVKHRESFRPFAPVVLEEKVAEYFELDCASPFMLLVAKVKNNTIPAVTHIDDTGRVQTVSREQNPLLHDLIKEFEKITGVPVILNTSFNDNGEPIVESPADAVRTFKNTNLDALIIGNYLLLPQ